MRWLTRVAERLNVRGHLFSDVRKLKNTPVSGDEITKLTKGA